MNKLRQDLVVINVLGFGFITTIEKNVYEVVSIHDSRMQQNNN